MAQFSVPADFSTETIDIYADINKKSAHKIQDTYGQLTEGVFSNSGRASDLLPVVDKSKLEQYIRYSRINNINFNYTLNGTCFGNAEFRYSDASALYRFLDELSELGVNSITVALPSILELVQAHGSKFDVRASTLCIIDTPNKARWFYENGVSRMVVDEMANRDFLSLQAMAKISNDMEVIVNSICHNQCVYRQFHQNQASHFTKNDNITSYYSHRCMMQRVRSPGDLMRLCWIRPEDMKYYMDIGINNFKIQGRHAIADGDIVKCVRSYLSESWKGNLLDLISCFQKVNSFPLYLDNKSAEGFIKPFLSSSFCIHDCKKCGYCDNYAKKCMNIESVQTVNHMAQTYYESVDEYLHLLDDLSGST